MTKDTNDTAHSQQKKIWLWQDFSNGEPKYLAFDNPYPCVVEYGDPLTLGEPCGYAIFKESVNGRPNKQEEAKCVNTHDNLVTNLKESLWQIKRMSQILERNGLNGGLKDTDGPILRAEQALEKAGVTL